MSVADWFTTLHTNLAITNGADISYRYKRITQRLNTDFWNTQSDTAHSIYVGSYGRDTAIDKISDLDMAFWLPNALYHQYNAHAGNGQSALLQAVRTSIQQTYPTTSLGADGQVLTISFTDNVKFEILPCFENTDGSSFTYPDSNSGGSWKTSNPRAETAAIKNRNDATNGNLKRLCRMMRAWKDKWTVPMGGLLIDTLAYAFINTWESRDKSFLYYDWMSRDFFKYMADGDRKTNTWRAPGSMRAVSRGGLFEYKARQCENLAKEAIQYGTNGYHASAKPNGEKSTVPPSPADIEPLHDQLREIYGRTVYSHKTHIIQAGMYLAQHGSIKLAEIILGAVTTAGVITAFMGKEYWGLGISAITSAALTALISYTKDFDLGTVATQHKATADQLWNIREKYLDLLTDLQSGAAGPQDIMKRRDQLREELNKVYTAARVTTPKAYAAAQRALKLKEDLTFSPDEIDLFLPVGLRKNKGLHAPPVS